MLLASIQQGETQNIKHFAERLVFLAKTKNKKNYKKVAKNR